MTVNQAIAANAAALKDGGALGKAKDFLRELFANGPMPADDAEEAADHNGIIERTLRQSEAPTLA